MGVQLRVVRIVSGLFALGVGLTLASSACSSPVALGGFVDAGDVAPPLPEAGSSEVDANEFRPLCKAADCPAPYTTCSDDAFGCETNVDIDNATVSAENTMVRPAVAIVIRSAAAGSRLAASSSR